LKPLLEINFLYNTLDKYIDHIKTSAEKYGGLNIHHLTFLVHDYINAVFTLINNLPKELPEDFNVLHLESNRVGYVTQNYIFQILAVIPKQITCLNIVSNDIYNLKPHDFKRLILAIPNHIEHLNLRYNSLKVIYENPLDLFQCFSNLKNLKCIELSNLDVYTNKISHASLVEYFKVLPDTLETLIIEDKIYNKQAVLAYEKLKEEVIDELSSEIERLNKSNESYAYSLGLLLSSEEKSKLIGDFMNEVAKCDSKVALQEATKAFLKQNQSKISTTRNRFKSFIGQNEGANLPDFFNQLSKLLEIDQEVSPDSSQGKSPK
jgi:hypothetical protein